ncbi:MAG: hypothetical protein EOO41_03620 [Methanobacteriota archaeon]|nr:MAG: hypothetical protein EOO41_03620 [Euryarchaeota archaeon]
MFKSEVDSDLLGSILRVLDARVHDMQAAAAHVSTAGAMASHSCADSSGAQSDSSGGPAADAAAFGVSVALLLSKGGMFDLARDFLTKDDLAAVSRIAAAAVDLNAAVASDVSSLRAAYRVL